MDLIAEMGEGVQTHVWLLDCCKAFIHVLWSNMYIYKHVGASIT